MARTFGRIDRLTEDEFPHAEVEEAIWLAELNDEMADALRQHDRDAFADCPSDWSAMTAADLAFCR
jgi:hypothetical protein